MYGTYCEYMHMEGNETKHQKEIEILKTEILHLKDNKKRIWKENTAGSLNTNEL